MLLELVNIAEDGNKFKYIFDKNNNSVVSIITFLIGLFVLKITAGNFQIKVVLGLSSPTPQKKYTLE